MKKAYAYDDEQISIHTLALRVTFIACWSVLLVAISIHTLALRVTATFGISYS